MYYEWFLGNGYYIFRVTGREGATMEKSKVQTTQNINKSKQRIAVKSGK